MSGSSSGGGGMSGGGGASSPSHSAANSTLNRPMSSQGGTRYEDKTLSLQRQNPPNNNGQANRQQGYRVQIPVFLSQQMTIIDRLLCFSGRRCTPC